MIFDEWLDAEYPDRADRQSKFRMSSVRALMAAAWGAGTTAERERCIAIVFGQCGSDNVAQRTVDAVRAMGDAQ
jgi:hypothetical protein